MNPVRSILPFAALLGTLITLLAPTPLPAQSYVYQYGPYLWTTRLTIPGGYVDAGNGDLHIEIPIASLPERGHVPFVARLVYDSHIWQQVTQTSKSWQPTNVLNSWGGWRLMTTAGTGSSFSYTVSGGTCTVFNGKIEGHAPYTTYQNFQWTSPEGRVITFNAPRTYSDGNDGCGPPITTSTGLATDSSGYQVTVSNFTSGTVYAPDGTQVFPRVEDTNGNYYSTPNSNGDVTDTLGRTPITTTVAGSTITYAVLNSQGTTSNVVVTTETIPVSTAFGQSGVTEYASTAPSTNYLTVIESVALPDGTTYQFNYDSGLTSGHYGTVTGMTVPTGGAITYGYQNFKDAYGNQNVWVSSSSWGGATGGTWSYAPQVLSSCPTGCTQQLTATGPSGEKTIYGFTLNNGAWATSAASYDTTADGGGLLQTITTAYNFANPPFITPSSITTTLPVPSGNITKKTSLTFDTSNFGNVTAETETGFYTSTGTAYRTTDFSYLANANNYMVNKKSGIIVCAGAGPCSYSSNWVSDTQISYDGATTSQILGVISHDDNSFGTSYLPRGNPTSIQRMSTVNVVRSFTYDMTGQVTSASDFNGNVTSYSYADSFFNDSSGGPTGTSPAGTTNAYITQVTLPAPFAWTIKTGYYLGTGQIATKTNQNGVVSTFDYLDSLSRPTQFKVPINGTNYNWALVSYLPSNEHEVDRYTGIADVSPTQSCSSCRHDQTNLDPYGRISTQVLVNDPEGEDTVSVTYAGGRVSNVTNPERSGSNPTDGSDTYTYDGLGRVTKVVHSDGTSSGTYYGATVTNGGGIGSQLCASATYGLGYPVLTLDEAAKKRQSWSDALGRIIELDEPDNSGNLTLNTCYTYDHSNNITGVTQGSQTRTYLFDSLSRLQTSTTPETGTIQTNHINNRSQVCSGDPSLLCQVYNQTSGIYTTYSYDQLNRLTSISYTDGKTPTVTYAYDGGTNQKGFLTSMTDGSGTTTWTYNNVGWRIAEQRTIAGITKTISYSYNGDGSIATVTYPSGRIVTYGASNAQRITSAVDSANSIQYAATASYSPPGTLNSVIYGHASGFNGITSTSAYNSRLEPTTTSATSSAGTAQNLSFSYALPTGNDGILSGIQNGVTPGLSETFTYDSLNRILSASTTATSGIGCWGQSYGTSGTPPPGPPDDRWSNLTQVNVTNCSAGALGLAVNTATNRVSTTGYAYDYQGNMSSEAGGVGYTYTYDAANRLTQAAGTSSGTWTYGYDGNDLRVEKSNGSSGTLYWRSISGQTIAESDLSGNITSEYVFFAGQPIARRDANNNVYYYYLDQLGSTSAITTSNGTLCYQATFTPYGQEMATQNTCPQNYKFTGFERDSETGLDYAFARYYNSRIGRFMSPDLIGGGVGDPQSLNRYAYVGNSPTNFSDPSGMNKCFQRGITMPAQCIGGQGYDTGQDDQNLVDGAEQTFIFSLADTYTFDSGSGYFETTGTTAQSNGGVTTSTTTVYTDPAEITTFTLSDNFFGGIPASVTAIIRARDQAYLQLSSPDCAKFLKGVLQRLGRFPNLDSYLKNFRALAVVPSPPDESAPWPDAVAHVTSGKTGTIFVDQPFANNLAATLLHEVFHTKNYLASDLDVAIAADPTYVPPANFSQLTKDQIRDASNVASRAFEANCTPKK